MIVRLQDNNGQTVEFVDEIIAQGGMKDVYFSPDRQYVVAFYRDPPSRDSRDRLEMICTQYREGIFNNVGGDYLRNLLCWPTAVVEHNGRLGMVIPTYRSNFFFKYGSRNNDALGIKGQEKDGKWFASATNRQRYLDPRELGNWMMFLKVCLLLARAVRRMHMAGLSHSDLSYRNCLIDPETGDACLLDLDGLVVPGKHPPTVEGTPDFVAPEVVASSHLDFHDPQRVLPSRYTDLHALAVLIYLYLLCRHPLRGGQILSTDTDEDERLTMGAQALFIEHPTNPANRIKLDQVRDSDLPWADTTKLPYTLTGPYLSALFERAFIDGLHNPSQRPSANDWEEALVKTVDLLQPCHNAECEQKWYVFDNKTVPTCPFCQTQYDQPLPVLNLYSSYPDGNYRPDNHRLMVYSGQSLFKWHINNNVYPNEALAEADRHRVGYFVFHNNQWCLVNENMPDLTDVQQKRSIPIGAMVVLAEGQQLLLSKAAGGRLVFVQMSGVGK